MLKRANYLAELHNAISAVAPVDSVRLTVNGVEIVYSQPVTDEQRAAAQAIVDGFNPFYDHADHRRAAYAKIELGRFIEAIVESVAEGRHEKLQQLQAERQAIKLLHPKE